MNPLLRRLNIILTIGGGFLGIAFTLQAFFSAKESNPVFYAMLTAFVALYAYGIFAGFRLIEKEETKHLIVFYWLQVPWFSSPLLTYHLASGFFLSVSLIDWRFNAAFRLGSDWRFSLFQSDPWGVGINLFALAMVIILHRLKRRGSPASALASTVAPDSPVTSTAASN